MQHCKSNTPIIELKKFGSDDRSVVSCLHY